VKHEINADLDNTDGRPLGHEQDEVFGHRDGRLASASAFSLRALDMPAHEVRAECGMRNAECGMRNRLESARIGHTRAATLKPHGDDPALVSEPADEPQAVAAS
jgi:hypothetical protein